LALGLTCVRGTLGGEGAFPLFDWDADLARETIQKLELDILDAIAVLEIHNTRLTSIAPTGAISLFAASWLLSRCDQRFKFHDNPQ
jgi:hypothetical protein